MHLIDCEPWLAENALAYLARHLAGRVHVGRPLIAAYDAEEVQVQVLTDEPAWWFVSPTQAERMVPLAGGGSELTRWRHGKEVDRHVLLA